MEKLNQELHKLIEAMEREMKQNPLKSTAIKKVGNYLHGLEHPKRETLDRLSLLAGFQDWESFRQAIYGDEESGDEGDTDSDNAHGDATQQEPRG